MTPAESGSGGPPSAAARLIGEYVGERPGPLLLIIAGLHGNELAGVDAARSVLTRLESERPPLRGRVLALIGNVAAVARRQRFLVRDLNRLWRTSDGGAREAETGPDFAEREALGAAIDVALAAAGSDAIILDLHSTSATSPPFTIISDTLRSRRVAFAIPVPVLLGLEEAIEGTLIEHLAERRYAVVAIEGGRHGAPETADRHVAALWTVLVASGMLDARAVPELTEHMTLLRRASAGLPAVVEVIHRHGLTSGDGFRMEAGLTSFTPVLRGRLLARDDRGEIRAPADGLLLLPHYQALGDDGFFLGRPVRRFWLALSAVLRHLRLDRMLPLLPGVERHPTRADTLVADPHVARWLVVQVFHLFGFRRSRPEAGRLVFSRRPEGW